jgi:hypothetical protein
LNFERRRTVARENSGEFWDEKFGNISKPQGEQRSTWKCLAAQSWFIREVEIHTSLWANPMTIKEENGTRESSWDEREMIAGV